MMKQSPLPVKQFFRMNLRMAKEMMKNCFLPVLLFSLGVMLSAAEVHINGNFQPTPGKTNWAPDGWWVNSYGRKVQELSFQLAYSEPDAQGNRTLSVLAPEDVNDFGLYGANAFIIPVSAGDKLVFSGEAKGSGLFRAGYYGFKTLPRGGGTGTVTLGQEFSPFSFEFMIKDGSGDGSAYIRPAFYFGKGAKVDIRNLKLDIEHTNPAAAARRGFRYYPVYKLSSTPQMDFDKDQDLWKGIPEARGFVLHKTNQWAEEKRQTRFKMAHDGKKLYLWIHCEEPDPDNIRFSEEEIQKPLNSVEFAISSRRGSNGTPHAWYQATTSGGTRSQWTGQIRGEFPLAIRKGSDSWQAQMAFDLEGLLHDKEKLQFGRDYFFNVGRVDHPPAGTILSSFAASGFGTPDNFSVLSFFDHAPETVEYAADPSVNSPYYEYLRELAGQAAGRAAADWEKEYASYGTASGTNLARALELSKEAAAAATWQEWQAVAGRLQALDKELRSPVTTLRMRISDPSAVKVLLVNGSKVEVSGDGMASFSILQGANVLAAELEPGRKLTMEVLDHPETLGRWRGAGSVENAPWTGVKFDDRSWNMVQAAEDGSFVTPACIRQILFWEQNYYGDYRLTFPLRKWNFSRNGIEQMVLFLDSPLSFPLDPFQITWDLPKNIRLLNNEEKLHASVELISSPLEGYHRYVYQYRDKTANVGDKKIRKDQLIFQTGADMSAGTEFTISYSRSAGNFVELTQALPCRILPEVNGRFTRNILWEPFLVYFPVTDDSVKTQYFHAHCKAGFNVYNSGRMTEEFMRATKSYPLTFFIHTCYPMDGAGWGIKGALFEYVKNTPAARAQFFDPAVEWGGKAPQELPRYMDRRETTRFCLSFAVNEGREEFLRRIREDVTVMLRHCPDARVLWNNWERHVGFGKLERCFCPRCKRDFAVSIGLDPEQPLSNEDIKNKYAREWIHFQHLLDGRVLGLVNEAVQGLGMQFMAYNGYNNQGGWMGANGRMLFNPGCPGNGQVNSQNQATLDNAARFYKEKCAGTTVVMGQMILPNYSWGTDRFTYCADPDGFFTPDTLKSSLVRSAAALHGGSRVDASMQGGCLYFIGEATRLISAYEGLFHRGTREDSLVRSEEISYPNALVLVRKTSSRNESEERLVLLFNEGKENKTVTVENLKLGENATAEIWESGEDSIASPTRMTVTIPPLDVTAIYIRDEK